MKKHFLGIFAVVLALGMSAFTSPATSKKTSGTPLYWYHVSGTQTVGPKINSTLLDEDQAMAQITECNDETEEFCLYGSTNPNLSGFNFGSAPPPDRIITKQIQ